MKRPIRLIISYADATTRKLHRPVYVVGSALELFDRLMRLKSRSFAWMTIDLKTGRASGWRRGRRTVACTMTTAEALLAVPIVLERVGDPEYLESLAVAIYERCVRHNRNYEVGG